MGSRPVLDRAAILAFRRGVGALDRRLPRGGRSLRRAAWAGLQDSMPRAALLSINARVRGAEADAWEHPSLVQVWGPRFSAFVVPVEDHGVFTLGRFREEEGPARRRAEDLASRLSDLLGDTEMTYGEAGRALGVSPNSLRYATTTGTILIRWNGARQPTIRSVPAPDLSPAAARLELARRFLHVFGPSTPESFTKWAGIRGRDGPAAFAALAGELTGVQTPLGDAWILAADEPAFREPPRDQATARLLPSGDAFYLLWGEDRELLVPEARRRPLLWTSRVWPGALLVAGEVAGTWSRSGHRVEIAPWRRLRRAERDAAEKEAAGLPLPVDRALDVSWQA